MKIRDTLSQYEPDPDNHFMTLINSIKLRKLIEDLGEQVPSYKFFCWLVTRYTQGLMLPESIETLCDSMGIDTTEKLDQWCNLVNGQSILDIIDPVFDFERNELHGMVEIEGLIKTLPNLEDDCLIRFGDAEYYFYSEDELRFALRKCPIDRLKYISSSVNKTGRHDCEDFDREAKAWFSSHGLGDFAFADAEVNFYLKGKYTFAHGINLVPLRDGRVVCIEPQKDVSFWLADKPEFGMGADEMKLRKIEF